MSRVVDPHLLQQLSPWLLPYPQLPIPSNHAFPSDCWAGDIASARKPLTHVLRMCVSKSLHALKFHRMLQVVRATLTPLCCACPTHLSPPQPLSSTTTWPLGPGPQRRCEKLALRVISKHLHLACCWCELSHVAACGWRGVVAGAGIGSQPRWACLLLCSKDCIKACIVRHVMSDVRESVTTAVQVTPVLGGFCSTDYVTDRVWATAGDGTKVPVSLVYR